MVEEAGKIKDCGLQLIYCGSDGKELPGNPIKLAQDALESGGIVAVKGLGGFHLACRIDLPETALSLRIKKQRNEKPFAVMCRDIEGVRKICKISSDEESLLRSPARPIVLLEKEDKTSFIHISENSRLGVMLPYTSLQCLLMEDAFDALVMTSANISELPTIYKNEEAFSKLHGIADGFLLHNCEIETRCDDSLIWVFDGKEYPARRSRGYVPGPLNLPGSGGADVLACGAEQKANFTLAAGVQAFPSQHIGDLKNFESFENYLQQIERLEKLHGIRPGILACDMHPDYISTSYAEERAKKEGLTLIKVQHHFAHLASCMADNMLEGEVLGVIWDGTGYGSDGTMWGGEFLSGGYGGFTRQGRIRPVKLPGGDRAVHEIWRTGISLLEDAGLPASRYFSEEHSKKVLLQLALGINCPEVSSMGRLFDGVAAIIGIKDEASYEGQAAILLESLAEDDGGAYAYDVNIANPLMEADTRRMIEGIAADFSQGVPAGIIAARFMNGCAALAADFCELMRERTGLGRVVLSGGTFQNIYVLKKLMSLLKERGFAAYHHGRVSTNDEGLSLGQLMVARYGGVEHVPCTASKADKDRG